MENTVLRCGLRDIIVVILPQLALYDTDQGGHETLGYEISGFMVGSDLGYSDIEDPGDMRIRGCISLAV